ncbi:unnamed protein product [Thelazia callipaeda]|uniref:CBM21 domain-containing protein n=1 Tax=Thelazia callipaeda TaxID=103827 RepID=A0A0N5CV15_THECL|nr:unnamed protein product [Thelazia callipaeda]
MTESDCFSENVFSSESCGLYTDVARHRDSTIKNEYLLDSAASLELLSKSLDCEVFDSHKSVRSVSLNSALKNPNRRRDKKAVHFADSLGLELVNVYPIYSSTYDSLEDLFSSSSPLYFTRFHDHYNHGELKREVDCHYLIRNKNSFISQMNSIRPVYLHINFSTLDSSGWSTDDKTDARRMNKARINGVCLKSVNIIGTSLTGIIYVANFNYKKEVRVRYTLDNWRTYSDLPAWYISCSQQKELDLFSFSLFLPQSIPVGAQCEFCIRYLCNGNEYWDNNDYANYKVECKSLTGDNGNFSM